MISVTIKHYISTDNNWKGLYTNCKRFNCTSSEMIKVFMYHGSHNLITNYRVLSGLVNEYFNDKLFILFAIIFTVIYYY